MGKLELNVRPNRFLRTLSFNVLPIKTLQKEQSYSQLPQSDDLSPLRASSLPRLSTQKLRGRSLGGKILRCFILLFLILGAFGIHRHRSRPIPKEVEVVAPIEKPLHWLSYPRLDGFYNGLRSIVPMSKYVPEYPHQLRERDPEVEGSTLLDWAKGTKNVPKPTAFEPYPNYTSSEYLAKHHAVAECFLDSAKTIPAPNIFAYNGRPQGQPEPLMGSHRVIGVRDDVCFDRFGRFGPYGYGYNITEGGSGVGMDVESEGSTDIWSQLGGQIDYSSVNWGQAQKQCFETNKQRFEQLKSNTTTVKPVSRSAVVIRSWTGYKWTANAVMNFRAMINELSLKSGGEYDIHFLMHVKDASIPIFASDETYEEVVNASVPAEFRGMVTLWTEKQMEMVYAGLDGPNFENDSRSPIHGAYRSLHLPLQWFAHTHPEYDYFWNWEMDMRYTGHYYELFEGLADFGRQQTRHGMWERNAKYYIPGQHGSWDDFKKLVRKENEGHRSVNGPLIFPGVDSLVGQETIETPPKCAVGDPVELCGVGEEVDLITFNPMFDPEGSGWVFEKDVTGYNLDQPVPPRRVAIITAGRLSKRLLNLMHLETYDRKHSMFAEMWPPTVALHHGLKAVFAPHPVYFDRAWPMEALEESFNAGLYHSTGGNRSSPFAQNNEHNYQGSTWYYNAGFAGAYWRRWLGHAENGNGGKLAEEEKTGRMCVPSTLLHPIKFEHSKST